LNKPLIAGNWKMNGLAASLAELKALKDRLAQNPVPEADVMVCPPATLLAQARYALIGSTILLGAQDCHPLAAGAHTGDVSAEMLADAGATSVIVGHSERRTDHAGEAEREAVRPRREGVERDHARDEEEETREDCAACTVVTNGGVSDAGNHGCENERQDGVEPLEVSRP